MQPDDPMQALNAADPIFVFHMHNTAFNEAIIIRKIQTTCFLKICSLKQETNQGSRVYMNQQSYIVY